MTLLFVLGISMLLLSIVLVGSALRSTTDTGITRSLAVLEAMTNAPTELTKDLDRSFADRVLEPLQQRALTLGRRLSGADTADRVRGAYRFRANRFRARLDDGDDGEIEGRSLDYQRLRRELLDAERAALLELRRSGAISNEVWRRVGRDLDLEDQRLDI